MNPDGSRVLSWVETMYGAEGGDSASLGSAASNDTSGFSQARSIPSPYIASLYYAAMTMTTVGYGDITPSSSFERVVCIGCMLVGGYTFGMVPAPYNIHTTFVCRICM